MTHQDLSPQQKKQGEQIAKNDIAVGDSSLKGSSGRSLSEIELNSGGKKEKLDVVKHIKSDLLGWMDSRGAQNFLGSHAKPEELAALKKKLEAEIANGDLSFKQGSAAEKLTRLAQEHFKSVKKSYNYAVDGVYGQRTWKAMEDYMKSPEGGPIGLTTGGSNTTSSQSTPRASEPNQAPEGKNTAHSPADNRGLFHRAWDALVNAAKK